MQELMSSEMCFDAQAAPSLFTKHPVPAARMTSGNNSGRICQQYTPSIITLIENVYLQEFLETCLVFFFMLDVMTVL
jgi:hypothetical protein